MKRPSFAHDIVCLQVSSISNGIIKGGLMIVISDVHDKDLVSEPPSGRPMNDWNLLLLFRRAGPGISMISFFYAPADHPVLPASG